MISFGEVRLGVGGDLACGRCVSAAEETPFAAEQIEPLLRGLAAEWGADPGPNVIFTGYEPFSHPDLPRLVADARAAGFRRVCLRTDAGALAIGGNARGVVGAGVTQLEVVVLGGSDESHDSLARRQGLLQAAGAGIAAFLAEGASHAQPLRVGALIPLCRHTIGEAPAAVAWAARAGADSVRFDAAGLRLSARELPLLRAALDTATINGVAAWVTGAVDAPLSPAYLRGPYDVAAVSA